MVFCSGRNLKIRVHQTGCPHFILWRTVGETDCDLSFVHHSNPVGCVVHAEQQSGPFGQFPGKSIGINLDAVSRSISRPVINPVHIMRIATGRNHRDQNMMHYLRNTWANVHRIHPAILIFVRLNQDVLIGHHTGGFHPYRAGVVNSIRLTNLPAVRKLQRLGCVTDITCRSSGVNPVCQRLLR